MKYFIKVWVFYVFSLWLTKELFPAFTVAGGWGTLFVSGFILSLLMLIVKPLLKILFIPITILTFGLLSWVINVVVIYLLTLLAPNVAIHAWMFPGIAWQGFAIPPTNLTYIVCLIITSLSVTCITNTLEDITES
ncbi:MAG: phage holin family protein [Candidatus Gottesmanbacteria bacterium]